MIAIVNRLASAFGQRVALWAALCLILISSLRIATRQGRHAAEADFAIRAVEARVRTMKAAKDIRHEVQNADPAYLGRRVDRWMRD